LRTIFAAGSSTGGSPAPRLLSVTLSKKQWMQLCWNADTRDCDVVIAEGIKGEPNWPTDKSLRDLLRLGLADKIIASPEHPYVMRLRGLAE
jgi:hypothetical protein